MGSDLKAVDQFLIRPSFEYEINKRTWLGAGYNWIDTYLPNQTISQNWVWEEFGYRRDFGRLRLINRFRSEQRFIENASSMSLRLRHLARADYELDNRGKWGLVFWSELFVNPYTVRNGPVSGIDQWRIFGGLRRNIHRNLNIELGYQPVFINPRQPPIDRIQNAIFLRVDILMK